jgi:ribonucleoside-diphosphate reductase alpha chain
MPTAGENYVPRRRRLNEERKAVTHKFQVGAYEGYLIVGLYDDGQPGEIFLRMNKEGSMLSGMMDSFATAISIGLQYGVPLKVLVKKFAGVHFEPNGPTQNPNIPHARSIMDYVFRWLAVKFLTPEERQTVLGLHDDQGMETLDVSNVDGARQSRLIDGGTV